MLKIHEIREIIKMVNESSIQQFEFEQEATKIIIVKNDVRSASNPIHREEAVGNDTKLDPLPALTPEVQAVPVAVKEVEERKEVKVHKVVSPMVGTFYSAPEPGAEAFVKIGQKIDANTVVCVLEAMKLFNEIEAGVSGEIAEILVKDGEIVEYGQPLFVVHPE
ncbi:acetyl-CoA carboxylase biotin carboxyl carrier protein [Ammoniphilus sp. 3BR4]|uniref:acetyl-CoA carboxylase biotin carboxyl carrier protein n=1 Tax=Ammoniphilus sp. 3BR4 TaxID=3158265 RepID=UPI0034662253